MANNAQCACKTPKKREGKMRMTEEGDAYMAYTTNVHNERGKEERQEAMPYAMGRLST